MFSYCKVQSPGHRAHKKIAFTFRKFHSARENKTCVFEASLHRFVLFLTRSMTGSVSTLLQSTKADIFIPAANLFFKKSVDLLMAVRGFFLAVSILIF